MASNLQNLGGIVGERRVAIALLTVRCKPALLLAPPNGFSVEMAFDTVSGFITSLGSYSEKTLRTKYFGGESVLNETHIIYSKPRYHISCLPFILEIKGTSGRLRQEGLNPCSLAS